MVSIGAKTIGPGNPAYVIAEMAWSHDGSLDKALAIVEGAQGADAVCFHVTSMPGYMARDYGSGEGRVSAGHESPSVYAYLESINLTFGAWRTLARRARERGLHVLMMPNDLPSLEFARDLADAYVLPAASFCEREMLEGMCDKPVFLRCGGATMGEMAAALSVVGGVLIDGFQSYPTRLEDMNLSRIRALKERFGVPVGFADHTEAGTGAALTVPLLARAAGADVIEKHLTHDRSLAGEDHESALNPGEFRMMLDSLAAYEALHSPADFALSDAEERYRDVCRKRAVAARDIAKGEAVEVVYKRSDRGGYDVSGVATRDIRKDEPIEEGDTE